MDKQKNLKPLTKNDDMTAGNAGPARHAAPITPPQTKKGVDEPKKTDREPKTEKPAGKPSH